MGQAPSSSPLLETSLQGRQLAVRCHSLDDWFIIDDDARHSISLREKEEQRAFDNRPLSSTSEDSGCDSAIASPALSSRRRVHWGDACGKPLATCRTFQKGEFEASRSSRRGQALSLRGQGRSKAAARPVVALVDALPESLDAVLHAIVENGVQLEAALSQGEHIFLTVRTVFAPGTAVRVRWSSDGWATFEDVALAESMVAADGRTTVHMGFIPAAELQLAVYATIAGMSHWDNNGGRNYSVEIVTP
jgi:hypothetical protein